MLPLLLSGLLGLSAFAAVDVTDDRPSAEMPGFSDEIFVVGAVPLVEPVEPGQPVYLVFGVGELEIEASNTGELRAEIVAGCKQLTPSRCEKARKKLEIEPRRTGRGLEIHMTGLSRSLLRKMSIEGHVSLPADSPLVAQIGIGDVEIRSGVKDLTVAMGIGDLTIHAPVSAIGSVSVKTRIGDASVRAGGAVESKRRMLIGARARWEGGGGPSKIEVGLEIGDATVTLD